MVVPELITKDMIDDLKNRGLIEEANVLHLAYLEDKKKQKLMLDREFKNLQSTIARRKKGVVAREVITLRHKDKLEKQLELRLERERKHIISLENKKIWHRNYCRNYYWLHRDEILKKDKIRCKLYYVANREKLLLKCKLRYESKKKMR